MTTTTPPRWSLSSVYPSLSSSQFATDFKLLEQRLSEFEKYAESTLAKLDANAAPADLATSAAKAIDEFNVILLTAGTLRAYISSFVSTDSYNKEAQKKESEFEQVAVRLDKLGTVTTAWIGKVSGRIPEFVDLALSTKAHAFFLKEAAEQSQFLMSPKEEALAAELGLSGANAWGKLQGTVTSQLSVKFRVGWQDARYCPCQP